MENPPKCVEKWFDVSNRTLSQTTPNMLLNSLMTGVMPRRKTIERSPLSQPTLDELVNILIELVDLMVFLHTLKLKLCNTPTPIICGSSIKFPLSDLRCADEFSSVASRPTASSMSTGWFFTVLEKLAARNDEFAEIVATIPTDLPIESLIALREDFLGVRVTAESEVFIDP